MMHHAIAQYDLIPGEMEGEIFIFKGTAIQADQLVLFTVQIGELVHDAAFYSHKSMLGQLSYSCQFKTRDIYVKQRAKPNAYCPLYRRGGRKPGPDRHFPVQYRVKAAYLVTLILQVMHYS